MLPKFLPAEGSSTAIRVEFVVVVSFAEGTAVLAVFAESRHCFVTLLAAVHLAHRLSYPTCLGTDLDSWFYRTTKGFFCDAVLFFNEGLPKGR